MSSDLVTVYKCSDGTDFPVTWGAEADAQLTWSLNEDHWPGPLKPLDAAAWKMSLPAWERAYSEAGLPPEELRKVLVPQGFVYFWRPATSGESPDNLVRRWGGAQGVWEEHCRPLVEDACKKIQTARDGSPIADLIDTCFYAFSKTMVAAAVILTASSRLTEFLVESFGEDADTLTGELTQGHSNTTMGANQALWEAAQVASRFGEVRDIMVGADLSTALESMGGVEGGTEFRTAFDRFQQRFGWRGEGWEAALPTWREKPETPLAMILRMIIDESPSPEIGLRAAARRREALAEELIRRLGDNPAKVAEIQGLLADTSSYVNIREDRAHWQLTAFGSLRGALLRRGNQMVGKGIIRVSEDILYLLPEEIDGKDVAVQASLESVVADRRRQWDRWSRVKPPLEIGASAPAASAALGGPAADGGKREVRGIAASRGVATGQAKVVLDLTQQDKLLPGDILVCRTTSPPWTVLFGRAAAVVADTGGPLAHTAIAAREYGVPCVVGARGATDRIHDGMRITVDGGTGIVQLET